MAKNELIFASSNKHKLNELKALLGDQFHLKNLIDLLYSDEIPETGDSFKENALIKARHVNLKFDGNVLADDSGLEVESLDGAPGVYSARYAGIGCTSQDNIVKLLNALEPHQNRKARFVTVLALIYNSKEYLFEGICEGTIIPKATGVKGFGYDPVFVPEGYDKTFAEMTPELKNRLSHRGVAIRKLLDFLRNHAVIN